MRFKLEKESVARVRFSSTGPVLPEMFPARVFHALHLTSGSSLSFLPSLSTGHTALFGL